MSGAEPGVAEGAVVADVMLRDPKTLPADATVGEVRELLERPSVQMVLLADAGVFAGAVTDVAGRRGRRRAGGGALPTPRHRPWGRTSRPRPPSSSLLGSPIVESWFSTSSATCSDCSV